MAYFHPENRKPLIKNGKVFKSVFDFQLTEEELKKAGEELGETEKNKERCLRQLKERLKSERTYSYCTDDNFLLGFLRVRKYDLEKAYKSVKDFYRCRKVHQDLFFTSPDFRYLLDKRACQFLPYTDSAGRIVFYADFGLWDFVPYKSAMACAHAINDVVAPNPRCQVNGIVSLWDARGFSLRLFRDLLAHNGLQAMLDTCQHGYPWRIKKIVVLNTGKICRMMYKIGSPLLSKKQRERFVLLGSDMSELADHLDLEILPKKVGGELDEEECHITDHVMKNFEYLRRVACYT